MLKRQYRLTKRDRPTLILKNGGTIMTPLLVIRFRENQEKHHRFTTIISQKISKKATERNRIRRQIQEIIRLNIEKFPQEKSFDIAILPKKNALNTNYQDLEKAFLSRINHLQ